MEDLQQITVELGDQLCDVTVVTKDDKEFKAHRNVLSEASAYFSTLFQIDMKESREGIVRLKDISGAVMEDVLEFIYKGSVEVTQENCKDLIAAANYFLIPGLKTVSGRFLERQMSKSSCISTFYFAEMYQCDELITNTRKFIHANFASVAEMDEFLNLEAKEVERWISSDEISVAVEADVFKIVLKWIEQDKSERKGSFEQLFRHVRLAFLSRDFLLDVVVNELVEENPDCLKLISKALKLSSFLNEESGTHTPRKGLETRAIVACGGKYTLCYLPEKDEWKRLANGLSKENGCLTKTLTYRDQLYAFQLDGRGERYDPVVNGWSTLDLSPTRSTELAVVSGEIFAIEENTSTEKSAVKRYDFERCSWETVLSSHEPDYRANSCVVAAGNHLYVCGGELEGGAFSKAERFDTVGNKWEEIANMQQKRAKPFGVASEGKIFVAGGLYLQTHLTTCEIFNVSTNEWQLIGSLNVSRICGSMVCLKGTLFVLGGLDVGSGSKKLSVECYDPAENKWIEKTTIPAKMICRKPWTPSFSGCVLKLSKGVLDKLDVIKEKS